MAAMDFGNSPSKFRAIHIVQGDGHSCDSLRCKVMKSIAIETIITIFTLLYTGKAIHVSFVDRDHKVLMDT